MGELIGFFVLVVVIGAISISIYKKRRKDKKE